MVITSVYHLGGLGNSKCLQPSKSFRHVRLGCMSGKVKWERPVSVQNGEFVSVDNMATAVYSASYSSSLTKGRRGGLGWVSGWILVRKTVFTKASYC